MGWKDFLLYNFLGAVVWVTTIALLGYLISSQFHTLLGYAEKASWAIGGTLFVLAYLAWWRYKKHFRERQHQHS